MKVVLFLLGLLTLVIQGNSAPKSGIPFDEAAEYTNLPGVVIGQFPWQAFIYDNGIYVGSGSIISDSWVLTVSKNCYGHSALTLKFGTIKHFDGDALTMESTDLRLYPEYDRSMIFSNDICLIKLPTALQFTKNIAAIKLLTSGQSHQTFVNHTGRISGFSGYFHPNMSWGEVQVVEQDKCLGYHRDKIVHASFCVKGNENMPYEIYCVTEMGVPLIIKGDDDLWMQIGFKSASNSERCWKDTYSVYQNLSPFLDFINNTTITGNN